MAFTQELEAPFCKICRDLWTVAKENCHIIAVVFLAGIGFCILSRKPTRLDGGSGSRGWDESEKKLLEVGFWGGSGGKSWDDGFFDGVRAITVQFGQCICSIQVMYDKDGIPVNGKKHGYNGHDSTSVIKLDYPKEYIVCIGGHAFFVENHWLVIRSLTFETNKRTFGPYGIAAGLPFTFPLVGMRIVGFKGRSEGYLDAIGFHVSTDTPSKVKSDVWLFSSIQKMVEVLILSTRQMIGENLAGDDAVSAASSS